MYNHLLQHLGNEIDPYDLKENNIYFVYDIKNKELMLLHFNDFAYEHVYNELVSKETIEDDMREFPGMIRELLEIGPAGLFFRENQDAIPIENVKIYNYKNTMKNYDIYKKKINLLLDKKRGHKISEEIISFLFRSSKSRSYKKRN